MSLDGDAFVPSRELQRALCSDGGGRGAVGSGSQEQQRKSSQKQVSERVSTLSASSLSESLPWGAEEPQSARWGSRIDAVKRRKGETHPLHYRLICVPQNHTLSPQTPVPEAVTVLEIGPLKRRLR